MRLLASALSEPLEVVGIVMAVAGLLAGAASAAELLRGARGAEISDAAAKGGAAGFLLGLPVGVAAVVYLALD